MYFIKLIYAKFVLLSLFIPLAFTDDCSVIKDILTQNNLEITWSPTNSTGCCAYEGINCVNDRIIQINFSSKGYTGTIESLMPLTSLQYININSCRFTGSIPSSIRNISNLQFFYAHGNKITGNIPKELAISTLQFIDLSDNKLEGSIPYTLGKVMNLQHINLSKNNLQGEIPSSFHSLNNIQVFRVSDNTQLCGEIPVLSKTLKDCNFASTSLCINGPREHCTDNIKTCDSVNCNGEVKISDDTSSNTNDNNDEDLGPEDYKKPKKSNFGRWIALGFIVLLVICLIILSLICCKKKNKKNLVVIDKPVPSHSNEEIFGGMDITDPDASIQIHSLNKPQIQSQQITVPVDNDIYNSQASSFDESSLYESASGRSSNLESVHKNYSTTPQRSPVMKPSSLNRSHLANVGMINTSIEPNEQDIGDIIISNNGTNINDNVPTISKRKNNLSNYSKSQSSPNLVRLNRYSIVNQNSSPSGSGNRRLTNVSSYGSNMTESSIKVSTSANSSPRHNSTPYPITVSPYAVKSSTINTFPRKSYNSKRKSSSGNEDIIQNHNTIHVVNNRKSLQYPVEKSPTKGSNYSETISSNSVHSQTPIMNKNSKNRNSLPPMNSKKPSILTKFSSQNSMNISPLATSIDNSYDISSTSDNNDFINSNNKKSFVNISNISSNVTINSNQGINNKASTEALPKTINRTSMNINPHISQSQENSYNLSISSDENNVKDSQNTINISNISSNHSSSSMKNSSVNIENINANMLYTNEMLHNKTNNITSIENTENPTEEIYIDDGEFSQAKLESIDGDDDKKEYHRMMIEMNDAYHEYDYLNENSIEEQQPPNYEEVFSDMYTPYMEPNDEAIRMQLEMRRIEERQLRMEYLQKQIDNPDISSTQRQKYIDALDRLMLE